MQNFLAARITALGLRPSLRPESRSTEELLRDLIGHFLADVFDTPISVLPKIIITEAGNFPELAKFYYESVVSGKDATHFVAGRLLQRGIDRGEFRPIEVEHAAHCVIGPLLLGMIWKHTFEVHAGEQLDAAALCRTHLDLLLAWPIAKEPSRRGIKFKGELSMSDAHNQNTVGRQSCG